MYTYLYIFVNQLQNDYNFEIGFKKYPSSYYKNYCVQHI